VGELDEITASSKYQEGDLESDAKYNRIHFATSLRKPEQLDQLVKSLRLNVTAAGIVKARAIEDWLMRETWLSSEYDLLPKLKELDMPALVIHGDYDVIPIEVATGIAAAIPGARLVGLPETGHFAYLESPDQVRKEINDFFRAG